MDCGDGITYTRLHVRNKSTFVYIQLKVVDSVNTNAME